MRFEISKHAREETDRRGLTVELLESILQNPQQIVDEYGEKRAYQSIINVGAGKDYLVRVIVDDSAEPVNVITVYRTTKIKKYWMQG